MLMLYSQFLLQYAVRSPIYLMNPEVHSEETVRIPRNSVIHYLDLETDTKFPHKHLFYFKEVPNSKKIPIKTILELDSIEEAPTLNNRYAPQEVRKWRQRNMLKFREIDLSEIANSDPAMPSIYNYNLLKDLRRYKTSLVSPYYEFRNLSLTYWNHVKASISANRSSYQIVRLNIPTIIPGYINMERIKNFELTKLSRIIHDYKLYWMLDLYKWLAKETRDRSVMTMITEEDASSILLELRYKDKLVYVPLSILLGVSDESSIESSIKLGIDRTLKLFLKLLRNIQEQAVLGQPLETDSVEESESDDLSESEEPETTKQEVSPILNTEEKLPAKKLTGRVLDSLSTKSPNTESTSSFIKELDESDDSEADELFLRAINSIPENLKSPNVSKTLDEFDEELPNFNLEEELDAIYELEEKEIEDLLTSKKAMEKNQRYVENARLSKTHTSSEIRSMKKLLENREALKNPYSPKENLDISISSVPRDIKLDNLPVIDIPEVLIDKELAVDPVKEFEKRYIESFYREDILASVVNLEKAGIVIKNYEVERTTNVIDDYETHKVSIKPINGKESTLYFRIPVIDEEGTFLASGVKSRLRKQKAPLPIVKVSPVRVALTSNYGKFFISRTERKANDPNAYLIKTIQDDYLGDNKFITKLMPGKKRLNKSNYPNTLFTLASEFNEIHTKEYTLLFTPDRLAKHIKEETMKEILKKGYHPVGFNKKGEILVMDSDSQFVNYSIDNPIGDYIDLFDLDIEKVPKPFSMMKVLGRDIPLGVVLSYYLGISALIKLTKTNYKVIGSNQRHQTTKDEIVLRFKDKKLILKTDTVEKELLFNGFLYYKDTVKQHNLIHFNDRNVYLNLVEQRGQGLIHLKELSNLEDLFIDPITENILKEINEPTDYFKLLLRANELLKDYQHPDTNDPLYGRIRGYDRIPGLVYRALTESVREHRLVGRGNSKINIDPYKVWNYVTGDSSVKGREEINPILSLKEDEAVVLGGIDGLDRGATPKEMRRFHPNETGLISEATVDSGDVALNIYLTPYAKLNGVRGTVKDEASSKGIKNISTAGNLSPMGEYDDPKRLNFVSIQYSHTVPSDGYKQPPIRTGYEYVMPHRVPSLYANISEEQGVVENVTDKLITVTYKNGKTKSYKVGKTYGKMEGSTYAHHLVSDLKKGDKLSKGTPISYHKDFFEKDWLDPNRLVMKSNRYITVALTVSSEVFEDASAVSRRIAEEMSMDYIEERKFILDFNVNLHNLVRVNDSVIPETNLFIALDESQEGGNLSEQTLALLQNLAALSPRSKHHGVVDRLEIKYNGDLSDMSPSVRKLATSLDKETYEETKGTSREIRTNKVTQEYRSDGKNLMLDQFELKIFIRKKLRLSSGDKVVFANQMKSVISDVYDYDIVTETGDQVDAMFSYIGVINRIVNSPVMIGTSARILRKMSSMVADAYFDK